MKILHSKRVENKVVATILTNVACEDGCGHVTPFLDVISAKYEGPGEYFTSSPLVSSVFLHLLHSSRVYFYIFSTRFECIFSCVWTCESCGVGLDKDYVESRLVDNLTLIASAWQVRSCGEITHKHLTAK
jgi:hypothetical protein